jgi:hypothetical protein
MANSDSFASADAPQQITNKAIKRAGALDRLKHLRWHDTLMTSPNHATLLS